MKIHAIRRSIGRQLRHLLAAGGVAVLGTTGMAQDLASPFGQAVPFGQAGATTATANATEQPGSPGAAVSFRNGSLVSGGEAFRVIDPSQVRTAASRVRQADGESLSSLFAGGVGQVGLTGSAGCQSCGGAGYGGCQSCGTARFGGTGIVGGCGEPCVPYRYVYSEALYMKRLGDEGFSLSPFFDMDDFDWEIAPRVTFGVVPDCVHGCEASFTGPLEWDRDESFVGTNLNSLLIPGLPVATASLSAFNDDARTQRQVHDVDYWSVEASRTLIGWQIAKILYGVRYIDYQEEYTFTSLNGASEVGTLQSDAENHLFGGQVGLDLIYPIARHATYDFRGRAGVYANFVESDYNIGNAGAVIVDGDDEDEELAGVFEIGSGVRFNLGEALSIRAGSELWYLTGIATSLEQINRVVRPSDGQRVRADDDVVIAGLTLSAEFRY